MENTNQNANNEKGAASGLRLSNKWQELRERMQHKRRFVVMDTDTFKETFSAELTGANIFTYAGLTFIVLLILASLLIAFTPLRGLIPGFVNPELREETIRHAQIIDSLEVVIEQHEQHIKIIQDVINGEKMTAAESITTETDNDQEIVYRRSKADSLLRKDIEQRNKDSKKNSKTTQTKRRK